jgi:hypothetical protein
VTGVQTCALPIFQKKWFLSLKKSSTLISQSNEILQADFFDTQRKLIEKLMSEQTENTYW